MYKSKIIKLFSLFILVYLLQATPVHAHEVDVESENPQLISVQFIAIDYFRNYFDVSQEGKATVESMVAARNVDKTHIYCSIQKYTDGIWLAVNSWSSQKDGNQNSLYKTQYLPKGFMYRLKSTAYVYRNGVLIESTSYTGPGINHY